MGVTDVIIGLRNAYQMEQDTETLQQKLDAMNWFAESVIAKVKRLTIDGPPSGAPIGRRRRRRTGRAHGRRDPGPGRRSPSPSSSECPRSAASCCSPAGAGST